MDKTKSGIYLAFLCIVLAWGLSWPANKVGLEYIPPLWFASLRLVIGAIAMFVLVFLLKKLRIPSKKDLPLIFVMGVFQIGLFVLFINLGLEVESAGHAAILVYTTPLWVMPIAIFFFGEANTKRKWIGLVLGFAGVLIMLSPWEMDWTNNQVLIAAAFLIGASLSLSISILCARHMVWHSEPLELIPWQLLVGAIIISAVAVILQPHPHLQWSIISGDALAYTAIIATSLGFWGMTVVSKELPSTISSIGILGVPVSGVFFSEIFFHEAVGYAMLVAMLCIITGIICIVVGPSNDER